MAKVEKRPVQPPNSAADGAWAPSRTLNAAAARVIATGSKRATAYHLSLGYAREVGEREPKRDLSVRSIVRIAVKPMVGALPLTPFRTVSRIAFLLTVVTSTCQ